MGREYGTH